jgi:hypothetical protein
MLAGWQFIFETSPKDFFPPFYFVMFSLKQQKGISSNLNLLPHSTFFRPRSFSEGGLFYCSTIQSITWSHLANSLSSKRVDSDVEFLPFKFINLSFSLTGTLYINNEHWPFLFHKRRLTEHA